jgi:prepilin-type N-terminal cleavage/methylation domain-containing protein
MFQLIKKILLKQKSKNKKGFGLLEIIISMTILSVGIVGVFSAFPRGVAIEKNSEQSTIANHLAQMKIEWFSNLHYDEITVGVQENNVRVEQDQTSNLYSFFRTSTVELIDQNFNPSASDMGLKKITVTISWNSVFQSTKSISLSTIASRR